MMDCGPTCLKMIAKFYGKVLPISVLRDVSRINRTGVSMYSLAEGAERIGFLTNGVKLSVERLANEVSSPCILHWKGNHFVVLVRMRKRFSSRVAELLRRFLFREHDTRPSKRLFSIVDPARGRIVLGEDEFIKAWLTHSGETGNEGVALLLTPGAAFFESEGQEVKKLEIGPLLKHLWQYKGLLIQLGIGMILGSFLQVLFPVLNQAIVDVGIGTQDLPFINVLLIAQMTLLASSVSVDFLRSWILLHIGTRLNLTVLSEFLAKLLRLPISFFDTKMYGDIMQRINDHQRIESFLTGHTINFVFSLFNLLIFGILLAYYNFTIFFLALGSSIVYAVWATLFMNRRRKLDFQRFGILSKNQSKVIQLIQGMQDIRLSGSEMEKKWEWEALQAALFKCNVRTMGLSQVQQAGAMLINQSKNIIITFIAAKGVIDGSLSLGEMMSIQYILAQFNTPVEQMIVFLQSFQDAQLSLERLNEIHQLEDEEPVHKDLRRKWAHGQDINVRNLSYGYPGTNVSPVLRNIDLTILNGRTTAIVGKSGSGKTTLLKILLRFYEPDSGDIYLTTGSDERGEGGYETNLSFISHQAWRRSCGVVMQDSFIFSDSIARNIAVSGELIDEEKLELASRLANISGFIESLPKGYLTKIGPEGMGISQGQKQRILIARAIYKEPDLLFFDEATNALDSSNESTILKNLESFFCNRTVIVVAHRLSTVRDADQIVVMDLGKIVEVGNHSELLERRGHYYELVQSQLK